MRRTAILFGCVLAGCSQPAAQVEPPKPTPPEPAPVVVARPNVPTATPTIVDPSARPPRTVTPPGPVVLLTAEGELDDEPGPDRVVLQLDGTLIAGNERGSVDFAGIPADTGSDTFGQVASLQIVEIDKKAKLRGILFTSPGQGDEDPPNQYQLFVRSGGTLKRVLNTILGDFGITEPSFPGDGTLRYVESGWAACGRAKTRVVVREEISLRLGADGMMRESARKKSTLKQDCTQLAACPFVYVTKGDERVMAGEILRNVRGSAAYTLQSLPLSPALGRDRPRRLQVRVAEEKVEVTHLDEIYIEAGGTKIYPRSCSEAARPAYCEADHVDTILAEGEAMDLEFDLPAGSGEVQLFGRGYYVPTPTLAQRQPR